MRLSASNFSNWRKSSRHGGQEKEEDFKGGRVRDEG